MKGCGVYMMYWDLTPHFYIGKSKNLYSRHHRYLSLINRNFSINQKIDPIIDMFGVPKFKVIEYCNDSVLDDLENKILKIHAEDLFNLNVRKSNTPSEYIHTVSIQMTTEEYDKFITIRKNGMSKREAIIHCIK